MKHSITFSSRLTLKEIIQALDDHGRGYLAVNRPEGTFWGMITERAIRNYILNINPRKELSDLIDDKISFATVDMPQSQIDNLLTTGAGVCLPVLDREGKLVKILDGKSYKKTQKPNPVVIMAGGLGSRLGELTHSVPKPMLPMGHKPILHIILDSLIDYGFANFYFCVNYKAEVIREYFGDGKAFGVTIHYIQEKESLGTAGALSLIEEKFEDPFILMNGDLITTLNFDSLLSFHQERNSQATMCVHEYNQRLPYGVVHTRKGKILDLEEKPFHTYFVNAGIYVLNPHLKNRIPYNQFYDITSLFQEMIAQKAEPNAYIINEFWVDIGQLSEYEATREVFVDFGI